MWQVSGAGLYLPGNAVRALAELGVGSAVGARANPIGRQRILDHRGRLLAEIDVDRYWGRRRRLCGDPAGGNTRRCGTGPLRFRYGWACR